MPSKKRIQRKESSQAQGRRKNCGQTQKIIQPTGFRGKCRFYTVIRSLSQSRRRLKQIQALKSNNRSLAAALDGARQDQSRMQDRYLQLQAERQQLLETVASLENYIARGQQHTSVEPAIRLLDEVSIKVQRAKDALRGNLVKLPYSTEATPTIFPLPTSSSKRKAVHFDIGHKLNDLPSGSGHNLSESTSQVKRSYPTTPHPLVRTDLRHQVQDQDVFTSLDVGGGLRRTKPQLSSTPFAAESDSLAMQLTPCIHSMHFSDCEEGNSATGQDVSPTEGNQPQGKDNSPGLPEREGEEGITYGEQICGFQRPKRKCTSHSLSYQEPPLNKKLRRGDEFTQSWADWSPRRVKHRHSQSKARKAFSSNKVPLTFRRRALQDLTNRERI